MFHDKIAIVICTKNEEHTIGDVIQQCQKYSSDIIIMDGHSVDQTREIATGLGAKVYLDHKKGKGDAIRASLLKTEKEILVFIDADGSHDSNDIPKLIGPILNKEADLVIGSRIKGGSDEISRDVFEIIRFLGSCILSLGISCRFGKWITECQNGFRAIKRDVALKLDLKEDITTIEQEMTIKALKQGYRVQEIPTHEYARKYGQSKFFVRHVWPRYIYSYFKYLFFK
jgi:glycosyltransferase involved in cell wall biosynthesis